jgi:hypothetical protein
VLFALSAAYSGMGFLRWANDVVKNRVWVQLRHFSGLVCLGSVVGAVAWGARMQGNVLGFEALAPGNTPRQLYALVSSTYTWNVVFSIVYPVEFICFIIAKLMLLRRLTNSATRRCVTCVTRTHGCGMCD